jgi:hypothetical protein
MQLSTFTEILMLVYILEFSHNGEQRSVVLRPIDVANGVILEETTETSGISRGRLLSGGLLEIPTAAITNVFSSWWKVDNKTNKGHETFYVDDAVVETKVENAQNNPDRWDENGALKGVEGVEKLPKDAKNSRIIRAE